MFIFTFCFLILTLLTLSYIYFTRHYDYWKKKKVDFIKPMPFFGCMWPNISLKQTAGEIIANLYNKINKDFFGIYVFDRPILIIKSPKLIKHILVKDFDYFRDRTVNAPENNVILSNLMFFKRGPEWKIVRSKMSPVFTSGKLKIMFDVILKESQQMIDYINRNYIDLASTESKEICAKFSTNVIARCGFGVEANCFQNENAEFRKLGRRVFDFRLSTAIRQGGSFFFPAIAKLFKVGIIETEVIDQVESIFNQVLQQRLKMNTLKGMDLIDILLDHYRKETHKEFSPNVAMAQAIQFYLAGFETVSSSMAFSLYELAVNPDVQDKLRKEIQTSIEQNGKLTYDSLMNLPYLDMVFSEVLRRYPVLPFLDREAQHDYKIPDTDIVIEKGTGIYIPLFGLHYDEKYFPNPEKFIPERFKDQSKINQDGLYYLPFGEGPRHCIGMRFALVASKIGIAQMVLNYQLLRSNETPDCIELEPKSIIIQSKVGVPIKLRKL